MPMVDIVYRLVGYLAIMAAGTNRCAVLRARVPNDFPTGFFVPQ